MLVASPRFRSAVMLLSAPALVAQPQDADPAERLYRSGDRAYAARQYKEALAAWGQLLQSSPRSEFAPEALLRLAHYQIEVVRNPDSALPYLNTLQSDYPGFRGAADAGVLKGVLLAGRARRAAELKDAIAEFSGVLARFPDAPAAAEARLHLGRAFRDQGQWGRALQSFIDAFRLHSGSAAAPQALFEAAETLDLLGDLPGSLQLLQRLRTEFPQSPEAGEAAWRMQVRVRHRLQKPPLRNEGSWPQGKAKWLKTPTVLALAPDGDLLIFQNGLDQCFRLHGGELAPLGPPAPGTRVMLTAPGGALWAISRNTVVRGEGGGAALQSLAPLNAVAGASLDRWGNLWAADAKTPALTLFAPAGDSRTLAAPAANALAPLPTGGVVLAADGDRKLLFLDAEGQPRASVPYGKDLPAAFKSVVALAADGAGQVAALVEGGDFGEGVVIFGPDGSVLRQATFKALAINGRITSLALDRSGGLILCDRRNDLLIRLN